PSDLFEEVVGEIEDEVETPELRQADAGNVRARGTARVAEVGEWLKVPLRHPEVDTVSGLVLALLDRPAEVGDEVVYDGVRFRVTEVAGRGVGESLVELVEDGE
ncbi:MAG: transporter associated domain-containing protein, partial [Longimicrobiaceae bacterium]